MMYKLYRVLAREMWNCEKAQQKSFVIVFQV